MNELNESKEHALVLLRFEIGKIFTRFSEALTTIANDLRERERHLPIFKALSESVVNQCFDDIESVLTEKSAPRIRLAKESDGGLVYVTGGKLKGRIAYYDDDDDDRGIVYLGAPLLGDYFFVQHDRLLKIPNYYQDWAICMGCNFQCSAAKGSSIENDRPHFDLPTEMEVDKQIDNLIGSTEIAISEEILRNLPERKLGIPIFSGAVKQLIHDDIDRTIKNQPRIHGHTRKGDLVIVTYGKHSGKVGVVESWMPKQVIVNLKPGSNAQFQVRHDEIRSFPMSLIDFDEMTSHLEV